MPFFNLSTLSKLILADLIVHFFLLLGVLQQILTNFVLLDTLAHFRKLFFIEIVLLTIYNFQLHRDAGKLKQNIGKRLQNFLIFNIIINLFGGLLLILILSSLKGDLVQFFLGYLISIFFYFALLFITIISGLSIQTNSEEQKKLRADVIAYSIFFYLFGLLRIGAIMTVQTTIGNTTSSASKIGIIIMTIIFIILWPVMINKLGQGLIAFRQEQEGTGQNLYNQPTNH